MGRTRQTHCKRGHEFTEENTYVAPPNKQHPYGLKQCRICRTLRNQKRREDPVERAKINARSIQWALDNPEIVKKRSREHTWKESGWLPEMIEDKLKEQDNKCAICLKKFTEEDGPHADHAHTTPPKPRGLLCGKCNRGIGMFNDNPLLLQWASQYILKYSS